MDRYANVQRITEIVRSLDVPAAELNGSEPTVICGAAYDRAMRIAHIEAGRHLYGGAAQVRYWSKG